MNRYLILSRPKRPHPGWEGKWNKVETQADSPFQAVKDVLSPNQVANWEFRVYQIDHSVSSREYNHLGVFDEYTEEVV